MKKIFFFVTALSALSIYSNAQDTSPYWSLSGNSNTSSSTKLGTTNSVDLKFFTNNTEKVRINTVGSVGIGTTAIDASAKFEIKSTTRGLLMSRMTKAQRDAIASPAEALLIYQTDNTPGFRYYTGGAWRGIAAGNLGNLTSPTAVNISLLPALTNSVDLGSSSSAWKDLYLRGYVYIDGSRFVSNYPGTFSHNAFVGANAGMSLTTGKDNTAFGDGALFKTTSGELNTAIGSRALYSNTTGSNSIAIGDSALYHNDNNYHNVGIGSKALYLNTTGYYNVAVGYQALFSNTASGYNTATGYQALYANTGGAYDNTANGFQTLYSNTLGSRNTSTGVWALLYNTTGSNNVANGVYALETNSIGNDNVADGFYAAYATKGNSNVAIGSHALYLNTTRSNLVAIGDSALYNLDGGSYNTSVGSKALYSSTTASYNTALGYQALNNNVTGAENTAVGFFSMLTNTGSSNTSLGAYAGYYPSTNSTFVGWDAYGLVGVTNSSALGYHAPTTASNQVRLGDANVTSIGGAVDFSVISDGRFKKNIKEDVPGLEFINQLRPVTYNFDALAFDQALSAVTPRPKNVNDKNSQEQALKDNAAATAKSKILYTGFIAQEVESTAKKINYDFSGVDGPKNDKDYYGLRYSEFVVPLVKAVQELSTKNNEKDEKIAALEARLERLESLLKSPASSSTLSDASLGQNMPNPFGRSTNIAYNLPQSYSTALVKITDVGGKLIKAITLSGSGKGTLNVDASILSAGAYYYSLYVDNKLVDTKKMVLAK